MASQPRHRRYERGSFFLLLRLVTALAVALISLPALNLSAQADELAPEPTPEVITTEGGDSPADAEVIPPAEEVPPPPAEEIDAKKELPSAKAAETVSGQKPKTDSDPTASPAEVPEPTVTAISDGELTSASYIVVDEEGPNDEPGQKDLTQLFSFSNPPPDSVKVGWSWDEIAWSGANTGDTCALFDTDGDGKVNYAVCVTIDGNPATQVSTVAYPSPRLYSCGDAKVDRCTTPNPIVASGPTSGILCDVDQTGTDPFMGPATKDTGDDYPTDTSALCTIPLSLMNQGGAPVLVNVCSYPSQEPNSDPSDCVLIPRDSELTIEKVVTPDGVADQTDFTFTFTASKGAAPSSFSLQAGQARTIAVQSGVTITVEETALQGWSQVSATCTDPHTPNNIVLNSTNTKVDSATCTFTNTPTASVQVNKIWVINGTEVPHEQQGFGLTATPTLTGPGGAGATNATFGQERTGYLAGDQVTINESKPTSTNSLCEFTNATIQAPGETATALPQAGYEGTLGASANIYTLRNYVTCNAQLTLAKTAEPQNGPTRASAWTLTATGGPDDLQGPSGATGTNGASGTVTADATYTLSESDPDPRYVLTGWACTNGVSVTQDNQVSVPAGTSTTCTATNKTAQLTLIKNVINDSGGTAVASDFTLRATPAAGLTPVSGPGSESGSSYWVRPGTTYALSETGPSGYGQAIECATGSQGAFQPATSATVPAGGSLTCRFTNDDQASKLTLEKIVDANGSGTDADASDFTLSATLQPSGPAVSGNGDPDSTGGVKEETVSAGTYLLEESGPSGFTSGDWSCGSNRVFTDISPQDEPLTFVEIGLNEKVTCQIINTAQKPTLTLVKVVEGNDATGGTAAPTAWTLTATGPEILSGTTGVSRAVLIGSYTLGESGGPSGYTPSNWDCGDKTVDGGSITLGLGDNVTCTITNVAQPSSLTLVKVVDNGATGATTPASAWTLSATGPSTISGAQGSASIVNRPVKAGTYTLAESGPAGYSASSWSCNGQPVSGQVTIGLGQSVTCTITNTAQPSTLRLVKNVVNAYATPASPTNWVLSANGPTPVSGAGDTGVTGVQVGTYTLSESSAGAPAGYVAGDWSCTGGFLLGNTVTVGLGDDVECAITNTAQEPTWEVVKTASPVSGSTVKPGDLITYTLTVTKTGDGVDPEDISVQDDLEDVLDDAELVDGSIDPSIGNASVNDATTLSWTIPVLSEDATLTYQVRVEDEAYGVTLRNHVTSTGSDNCPPLAFPEDPDCTTNHPTPDWELTKTSNPASGSTVEPGESITYTLTATNTSDGIVDEAIVTDNLSEVLDNATLGTLGSGLSLVGTTLTWDVPTLQPAGDEGDSASVSYTVTVNAGQWDQQLRNVATPGGDGGSCPAPGGCTTNHPTPDWALAKTSNPPSGATVQPGSTVVYTLTATNTSDGVVDEAIVTDNLTEVLDNATLTEPLAAGLTRSGTTLTWDVPTLQPGGTATVSYTVTVNAAQWSQQLRNVATPANQGGDCPAPGGCTTSHQTPSPPFVPTPAWSLVKSSNPASGSSVEPGDQVTYTLTATNTSQAVVDEAVVTDNLADVLDNATLSQPLAAGLSMSGSTLTWDVPTLSPTGVTGATASVSYTVTVNADQWDESLRNVVTPSGDGGQCPTPGGCQTVHPTPAWELTKVSDPASGSEVDPGSEITYTLTAVNTSDAVLTGGLAEDDLSEVLNNASLDETSLDEALSLDGTTLTWALPTLLPGEEATVSYTVTVDLETSSVVLENVVVPISGGGLCVEPDDCTTTHSTPEILGEEVVVPKPRPRPPAVVGPATVLPDTGAPEGAGTMGLLGIGGLLVGGFLIITEGRRRRARELI